MDRPLDKVIGNPKHDDHDKIKSIPIHRMLFVFEENNKAGDQTQNKYRHV